MDRSKLVAVITGAIAILLSVAYLIVVQLLDFRGEMVPAPDDLSYRVATPPAHGRPIQIEPLPTVSNCTLTCNRNNCGGVSVPILG
ncbi:MAG: hypothetical protein IGS50_09370 [Synechococcales cyanobacterium C42_A2020_086]|jgi:hypothetical protein|nr:hypothetical protein [Synechococcales cyanobacterium M58_A2018_015]MBF2073953.1 hypothetical protein [Synechococcales cyanobacterium C42_A2020_086]